MIPHELITRYVIPQMKALIAHELSRRGVSQQRIAKYLCISQPMVSRYLSTDLGKIRKALRDVGLPLDEVKDVVEALANHLLRGDKFQYLRLFTMYLNTALYKGYLCRKHLEIAKELPPDCKLCMNLFASPTDVLVEEVKEMYDMLREIPNVHFLVPEVGMNVVAAEKGASSVMDVVGFEGRIFRVGTKIRALGLPARGGSKHTAAVLLEVMRKWPDLRYSVVLKYLPECVKLLRNGEVPLVQVGPHTSSSESAVIEDLRESIGKSVREPRAIIDLGGPGLEPVIYLVGRTPSEILGIVRECTSRLSPNYE